MEILDTHQILEKYHKISGTNKGIDESFKEWVAVDDLRKLIDENIGNIDFTITLKDELNKGQ